MVEAVFFGRYEHSLDQKGRVILPAKFRPHFERGGYLTQYQERCLALWTPEEFATQIAERRVSQSENQDQRNLTRLWAQGVTEVEIDRSGRMPIPGYLREFARLTDEVLVNGAIDRVELWSPELFSERVAPIERQLTDEAD